MTVTRENVVLIHWHDLGRHLGAYGHTAVRSPNLDQLAAEGFLFTDAHATAPLCSPSRGSLFTGRYPHSNGLIGLAHHGWEYRPEVRTLPSLLSESGWYTVLYGMQHETAHPPRLGFDEYDVSNAFCEYVTAQAKSWLHERDERPFLLTAGFFETHRPYPADRYTPTPVTGADVPSYLPDTPAVRADLAEFYGSIEVADAAVGELLETLSDTGLDENTWSSSSRTTDRRSRGRSRRCTPPGPGFRSSSVHLAAGNLPRGTTTTCSAASTSCPPCSMSWD